MKTRLFLMFFVLALSLGIGELVLRRMGYSTDLPYDSPITQSFLSANHKRYYEPDSVLGWRLLPGRYILPVEVNQITIVNHDSSGFRISSFGEERTDSAKKIFLFGCSFVYGVYLSDSETLAFRVQKQLKDTRVYDMAIPAYGNVQSLLSLKQQIGKGNIPQVVVLAYSSAHDERNYMDRRWQKQISHERLSFREKAIPYARTDKNGNLEIKYRMLNYKGFPFREYSVLSNLTDDSWNNLMIDKGKERKVSYAVIREMYSTCKNYKIKFVVAGISNDPDTRYMVRNCKENGMETVDLSKSVSTAFDERITPPDANIHLHYSDSLVQMLNRKVFSN